jgi:hypothetical protein
VVAYAAAHLLTTEKTPVIEDEKLVIPLTSLEVALNMLDSVEKKQNELKEEVAVSGDLVLSL